MLILFRGIRNSCKPSLLERDKTYPLMGILKLIFILLFRQKTRGKEHQEKSGQNCHF